MLARALPQVPLEELRRDVHGFGAPGVAHPEGVGGVFEGVDGGLDAGGLEAVHHLGAADFEGVFLPLDEDRGRNAGADVGDGGGLAVEVRLLIRTGAEEEQGALVLFALVGGDEVLRGGHDDAGLHGAGLVAKGALRGVGVALERGVGEAAGHADEAGEVAAGGAAHAADALGVNFELLGMGAQAAQGGLAVVQRGGVLRLGGEAVADEGGDKAALGQAFHHGLVRLHLALGPAAAVDVQDAGPGAGGVRHIDVELHGVVRVFGDLQGLQGEPGRGLRVELFPLRAVFAGGGGRPGGRGLLGLRRGGGGGGECLGRGEAATGG